MGLAAKHLSHRDVLFIRCTAKRIDLRSNN
jgi:hypothetical protein